MADEFDQYKAKPQDEFEQYKAKTPAPPPEPSMLQKVGSFLGDVNTGLAQGLGNTGSGIIHALHIKGSPEEESNLQRQLTPENKTQSIAKTAEQAGEFLIPGAAEEKAASLFPKAVQPLARIGAGALSAGTVNKAQGGDFGTGAAGGAAAGALGEGLRYVAPKIAESALGIRKVDRAYGKTPGEAVLAETRGVRPATVAESAEQKLGQLTPAMEGMLPGKVASSSPSVRLVDDAIAKATEQNNATLVQQLEKVRDQLTREFNTGNPIPAQMPAEQLLNLKRGLRNQFVTSWNPETMKGTRAVAANAAHAADTELDRVAGPEFANLNQRISSLIPVGERAESASRNADLTQRVFHRAAAHTGALAGGLTGGYTGYREGGIPGMMIGGTAGLVLPEVVASPTSQMIAARTAANPLALRVPLGLALQMKKKQGEE